MASDNCGSSVSTSSSVSTRRTRVQQLERLQELSQLRRNLSGAKGVSSNPSDQPAHSAIPRASTDSAIPRMPAHSAISRTSTGSEAREGMRRRIQLAQPCGEAGAEGRGGEGREGEGYRGRSGSDAQPGRQGVCAEPGGVGRAGFGNTVPAREEAELRCGSGAERCNEAQRVGLRLQGEHAVRGGRGGGRPLMAAVPWTSRQSTGRRTGTSTSMDMSVGISMHMSMGRFQGTPHGTLGRETELDRRLEAALRSGDHTAALRVNEAIIRRESARRQRQAEWHMQLAASLQEQESARRKKRQRLNWGMDVLRKSEGKGNM